jgi:N-acetylglutamate synthase
MLSNIVEKASLRAWPGMKEVVEGPWLVRTANGYTKRANSAWLCEGFDLSAALVAQPVCEAHFRAADLRPVFRVPSFLGEPELDSFFAQCGYNLVDRTRVMVRTLSACDDTPVVDMIDYSRAVWVDIHAELVGLPQAQRAQHEAIVSAVADPCLFAVLVSNRAAKSCGMGVLSGSTFGLFDLVTHPRHRGEGLGSQLIRSMCRWAQHRGAEAAYLQVVESNDRAAQLYSRLGFTNLYSYWYWVSAI